VKISYRVRIAKIT